MLSKKMELKSMDGEDIDAISKNAGAESEDVQKDIREKAKGNPGSSSVLGQLATKGAEIYNTVAPNLGTGSEIWKKYSDECDKNLDTLIKKYGK